MRYAELEDKNVVKCNDCSTRTTVVTVPADEVDEHNAWHDLECLDRHDGNCSGAVEYRSPLSATGKSFPRCDAHWSERLDHQERINRRYPERAPSDFDPSYAVESWDEDY